MSEKLCVQWNNFHDNIRDAFQNLRDDQDFADVTLVSGDGKKLDAHRVILAAASPLFQKILGGKNHSLIYMRGVTYHDLLAMLDFAYRGEANIEQENLNSFLAMAEELQLRGLSLKLQGGTDEKITNNEIAQKLNSISTNYTKTPTNTPQQTPSCSLLGEEKNKSLVISNNLSGEIDLEKKVRSLMKESQNNYLNTKRKAKICKVCGKEGKGNAIKLHIEVTHLEKVVVSCNLCDKTFRSRQTQNQHQRKHHQDTSFILPEIILEEQ